MDISDTATQNEEIRSKAALSVRKPVLPHIGKCHWCEYPTTGTFCSVECREDYEVQQRFKNGGAL
jgi:hypothetical protein